MKSFLHKLFILSVLFIWSFNINAQTYSSKEPFAHTFSIVAQDPVTGDIAVGVQSHWFSVGSIVSWAKSGVGVVATQSFVNPAFGPDGLKLMSEGKTAEEAIKILIDADEGRDFRQLAMLDASGNAFSFTGKKCVASADNIIGENYSVQANMMLNDDVVPAMAKAFEDNKNLPIAERVVKSNVGCSKSGWRYSWKTISSTISS